ncbi:MAG: Glycosyl transferase, family 2 [uncultured Sulfurovum sp.]|uniref:Glycosyl transferase, family 2 n=1 Tax=uncultured Sulfurovum sp. TaxID=269237 RepID=A0A6S6SQ33_9BACT|nr:MAG: Glycosyl transferase, family 2 [uncultured Sulfurovum sp.]
MPKIGLVVLNFITYNDTYETIKSLSNSNSNSNVYIYIVDNKTDNKKYRHLKNQLLNLNLNYKIIYLSSEDNLGFAKGMNIGIDKARKDGCTHIICSNNDIQYNKKIDFNKFINIYNKDKKIAVIGPKILNPDCLNQNPYMIKKRLPTELYDRIKQKIIFTNIIGKYIFMLRGIIRSRINRNDHIKEKLSDSDYVYCLHGSYFILTPAYFGFYKNLDSNTFLYVEELILAERVQIKGLKKYYYNDIEVFHKDDSATNEMLGKDSLNKILFILNENYKSLQYFMKEYIWKR